jgi:hypothetical protein
LLIVSTSQGNLQHATAAGIGGIRRLLGITESVIDIDKVIVPMTKVGFYERAIAVAATIATTTAAATIILSNHTHFVRVSTFIARNINRGHGDVVALSACETCQCDGWLIA